MAGYILEVSGEQLVQIRAAVAERVRHLTEQIRKTPQTSYALRQFIVERRSEALESILALDKIAIRIERSRPKITAPPARPPVDR